MIKSIEPASCETGPKKTEQSESTVVFVGGAFSFSDLTIRIFKDAFPSIRALRVSTQADLHLLMQTRGDPAMVVFEQSFFREFIDGANNLGRICGKVRMVLAYSDPRIALRVLKARRAAPELKPVCFLPMERNLDTWLAISGLLLRGESYLPPEVFEAIDIPEEDVAPPEVPDQTCGLKSDVSEDRPSVLKPLTEREAQILSMVALGKQNKIIAGDLGLSVHTVKLHIHHVIRKLGVNNRTAASAWYHERFLSGSAGPQVLNG